MAFESVKKYFSEFGIADRIKEFDVSSATVELAAQALGCEPCRIAKTLSFMAGGHAILIVTAGDAKIDNQKKELAQALDEIAAACGKNKNDPVLFSSADYFRTYVSYMAVCLEMERFIKEE